MRVRIPATRGLRRLAVGTGIAAALALPLVAIGAPAQAAPARTAASVSAQGSGGTVTYTNNKAAGARSAAVPNSAGPICGTGASSGNVTTCFTVSGAGLFVNWFDGTATVNDVTRTIQVCIHGPNGAVGCTPFVSRSPGQTLELFLTINNNVPAGSYCTNTWRLNTDGSHTLIGHECATVHP
ncbi:MAG TPA: hypothetical protein VJT31_20270 [Rugosimonospora sp.]|nr:hypothetical protein [Rugosimonospora sp.]